MRFGPPVPLQSMTLKGAGTSGGALTPPSAPFTLAVEAELGSETANLTWTATNKTGSPGFGYRIYRDIDGGGFSELATSSSLSYNDGVLTPTGQTYTYYIAAYNAAGEGVVSNEASVILPGESGPRP